MAIRIELFIAFLTLSCSIAIAQDENFPALESADDSTQQAPAELPPATKAASPVRRPAPAAGVPWSSKRPQPRQTVRPVKPATRGATEAAAPATPKFDPNARPLMPKVGKADMLKAYELTRTADSEEEYGQIIELCKSGLHKGVEGPLAAYGRKLSAWAYNRRGESSADAGKTKEAFEDFESAIAMDGKQWRAIHNRGVSHALLGNHDAAIADFTHTIELNPKFANAWFNRGEMHYEKRDFVSAVRDYNQALKLNPRDAAALNSRGHALYRQRRTAEALVDYNKALEIDPSSAAAHVNRGDLHADQGKFAEAAEDYRAAISINPTLGRAYQSAAWLMATCPDEGFRNVELAIEAAQKAIELDGDSDYRYLETLAAAQASAGEFEVAIKTQTRAMEEAPDAVAQVYKGRIEKFKAGHPHREPASKFAAGSAAASRR